MTGTKSNGMPRWFAPVILLGGGLLVVCVASAMVFRRYENDGPSMQPTLRSGETFVVVRSWAAGAPEPGEVVVVVSPMDDLEIVKRVIAVGGQRISLNFGVIHIDGEPVVAEPVACPRRPIHDEVCAAETLDGRRYLTMHDALAALDTMEEVLVPAGHVFVMGDHRDSSNDSRNPAVGLVPLGRVVGIVQNR